MTNMNIRTTRILLAIFAVLAIRLPASAADDVPAPVNTDGFTNTPIIPGTKWHIHDPNRPQPKVVTPGTFSTPEMPGKPPSDAVVLFGGKDLAQWRTAEG